MKKIFKYYEYLTTKIVRKLKEKKYIKKNKTLRYIYEKNSSSKNLLVIFSACTRKGIKARYNYIKTLSCFNVNKLFILDDFGDDKRGCYYLGSDLNNEVELMCLELIKKIQKINNIDKIICIGSSKGGWAALNIMLDIDKCDCIIGAPQYLLGNYLLSPKLEVCKKYIMRNQTNDEVKYLNDYIKNKITENSGEHKIYLHYSKSEHTYDDHIVHLIKDIKENNSIVLYEDVQSYTEHSEVSSYFPYYLKKTLEDILSIEVK